MVCAFRRRECVCSSVPWIYTRAMVPYWDELGGQNHTAMATGPIYGVDCWLRTGWKCLFSVYNRNSGTKE
jgi:hypothetical protein